MHNLDNIMREGFVAGDHLQMIVTGRTTDAAAAQKGTAQISTLTVMRTEQGVLQIALHT